MQTSLKISLVVVMAVILLGVVIGLTVVSMQPRKVFGDSVFTSSMFNQASTTQAFSFTSSTRILGTTTTKTRAWVHICNDSAVKVYINMNADAPASTTSMPLAANTCQDINTQNLYTGAIQATSSATSATVTVASFEL